MIELVLGGARSGKSRFAEKQAMISGLERIYVATAQALDAEMSARITHHQLSREPGWRLIEEPLCLAEVLGREARDRRCILVDCLTLWVTNCLLHVDTGYWPRQRQALLDTLPTLSGQIILVSNEVGLGIVPLDPLSRRFVDEVGFLHQALAQISQRVTFVIAGLPQTLKG